jgi:hypothetical protein
MLNRSTIAISVDSLFALTYFGSQSVQQNRMPYRSRLSTTEPIVSSHCGTRAAPHRAVSKW